VQVLEKSLPRVRRRVWAGRDLLTNCDPLTDIATLMATVSLSKAEKSYIQASFQATPPLRGDGRGLHDYRTIALETGIAPLANGSARLKIGQASDQALDGTEVMAAARLEVVDTESSGAEEGRISCSVSWCVLCLFLSRLIFMNRR